MSQRADVTKPSQDDNPENPVLIALPKHFTAVLKELLEPATVKFLVYSHFGDLAEQLQKQHLIRDCLGVAK
ncbi:hypothetical protein Q1695_006628 [Nippostrongylus brasiliensis]|nr:hypothetical protein Q1695_006628 [Nippostrongylus brasiliensis]